MSGFDLHGAVALVTGAGGYIGGAICTALSRQGATVVGADLRPAGGMQTVDVTDAASWQALIGDVRATHGRLDILVNNAGIAPMEPIATINPDTWRRTMAINVEGVMLGLQAATPLLRETGTRRRGGASVINIASAVSNRPTAFSAGYCTSKAALAMLTKVAAIEFSMLGYPIRVNSVHPGAVRSPMVDNILQTFSGLSGGLPTEQIRQAIVDGCPMKRLVEPDEVAEAVVYLACEEARFVHGTEQYVDGGYTAA
jgi:NAD(P)-dependent dehydrogenase (short-subunit alcohol dehydrogenase family)